MMLMMMLMRLMKMKVIIHVLIAGYCRSSLQLGRSSRDVGARQPRIGAKGRANE